MRWIGGTGIGDTRRMANDAARIRKRCRIPTHGRKVDLGRFDPDDDGGLDKERGEKLLDEDLAALDELQEKLVAAASHGVLVVLQAMDTGGKDGTIRKVFGPLDSLGLEVHSFKKPTPEELAHDFLWRVHQRCPPKGRIGVLNRSHYEDVLVVRVHGWASPEVIEERYRQINDFERMLTESGTRILKLFLHISRDEQRKRLEERLADPTKHWKFQAGDIGERNLWDHYMEAYAVALRRCSTPWAPWYVIPANRKWYRNHVVARLLRHTLEDLDLRYPPGPPDLRKIKIPK